MIPYVIENSGSGQERVYDLFSRLLKDRIIFIGEVIDSTLANSVVAQLLFLEAEDPNRDITIYINSPGGIVTSCLAIYDAMNYIKPDISTVCIGEAASASAFILSAGTKGKRYALINSKIMMHQISSGTEGVIQDMRVHIKEFERVNEIMLKEIAKTTGHTIKEIKKDLDRDYYMSAAEAKKYGIIDEVFVERK